MLYNTYENCVDKVGEEGTDEKTPLLPIAHSTQNAQVEVILDGSGTFMRAVRLSKEDAETIIPVTEDSATRSGTLPPPHPLCDKLQYVAGDFSHFVEKENVEQFYEKYIEQLNAWCNSDFANLKVNAVLNYLSRKTLIADLIKYEVLFCDESGKLTKELKIGGIEQRDAFIRFKVEIPGEPMSEVWLDKEIYDSHISYYLSKHKDTDLCYASGKIILCSEKHPAKIRHTADKSKLISANDSSGFTYRGRFTDKNEVVSVGYETSQKAHNVLRWLINTQGYTNGEQAIVAWGTRNQNIPQPLEDTYDIYIEGEEAPLPVFSTKKAYAESLNKAIAGYGCDLHTRDNVVVMCLEAATTGRLSITYYREINGSDFLDRIAKWHRNCAWQHTYKIISDGVDEKRKRKYKCVTFVGAPAPRDIALVAFGAERNGRLDLDDKLQKSTVERLLPCIIDGARIPYDIVKSAANRASNPVSMNYGNWNKTLSIACSLVKKYLYDKKEGEWDMALDENQRDRNYLFGRLLAIADQIERSTFVNGEIHQTNAMRYMSVFSQRPYKTWKIIEERLIPYEMKLGLIATKYRKLIDKVHSLFEYEEYEINDKLDGKYLLGFHCQRQAFEDERIHNKEVKNKNKLNIDEGELINDSTEKQN